MKNVISILAIIQFFSCSQTQKMIQRKNLKKSTIYMKQRI